MKAFILSIFVLSVLTSSAWAKSYTHCKTLKVMTKIIMKRNRDRKNSNAPRHQNRERWTKHRWWCKKKRWNRNGKSAFDRLTRKLDKGKINQCQFQCKALNKCFKHRLRDLTGLFENQKVWCRGKGTWKNWQRDDGEEFCEALPNRSPQVFWKTGHCLENFATKMTSLASTLSDIWILKKRIEWFESKKKFKWGYSSSELNEQLESYTQDAVSYWNEIGELAEGQCVDDLYSGFDTLNVENQPCFRKLNRYFIWLRTFIKPNPTLDEMMDFRISWKDSKKAWRKIFRTCKVNCDIDTGNPNGECNENQDDNEEHPDGCYDPNTQQVVTCDQTGQNMIFYDNNETCDCETVTCGTGEILCNTDDKWHCKVELNTCPQFHNLENAGTCDQACVEVEVGPNEQHVQNQDGSWSVECVQYANRNSEGVCEIVQLGPHQEYFQESDGTWVANCIEFANRQADGSCDLVVAGDNQEIYMNSAGLWAVRCVAYSNQQADGSCGAPVIPGPNQVRTQDENGWWVLNCVLHSNPNQNGGCDDPVVAGENQEIYMNSEGNYAVRCVQFANPIDGTSCELITPGANQERFQDANGLWALRCVQFSNQLLDGSCTEPVIPGANQERFQDANGVWTLRCVQFANELADGSCELITPGANEERFIDTHGNWAVRCVENFNWDSNNVCVQVSCTEAGASITETTGDNTSPNNYVCVCPTNQELTFDYSAAHDCTCPESSPLRQLEDGGAACGCPEGLLPEEENGIFVCHTPPLPVCQTGVSLDFAWGAEATCDCPDGVTLTQFQGTQATCGCPSGYRQESSNGTPICVLIEDCQTAQDLGFAYASATTQTQCVCAQGFLLLTENGGAACGACPSGHYSSTSNGVAACELIQPCALNTAISSSAAPCDCGYTWTSINNGNNVCASCSNLEQTNQDTGNCELIPCASYEQRNEVTQECELIPCTDLEFRNEQTQECELIPCTLPYVRNTQTQACELPACPTGTFREGDNTECQCPAGTISSTVTGTLTCECSTGATSTTVNGLLQCSCPAGTISTIVDGIEQCACDSSTQSSIVSGELQCSCHSTAEQSTDGAVTVCQCGDGFIATTASGVSLECEAEPTTSTCAVGSFIPEGDDCECENLLRTYSDGRLSCGPNCLGGFVNLDGVQCQPNNGLPACFPFQPVNGCNCGLNNLSNENGVCLCAAGYFYDQTTFNCQPTPIDFDPSIQELYRDGVYYPNGAFNPTPSQFGCKLALITEPADSTQTYSYYTDCTCASEYAFVPTWQDDSPTVFLNNQAALIVAHCCDPNRDLNLQLSNILQRTCSEIELP